MRFSYLAGPWAAKAKLQMTDPQTREVLQKNQLLGALEPETLIMLRDNLKPGTLILGTFVASAIECANIDREGAFGIFTSMYNRVSLNNALLEGLMLRCAIEPPNIEF